MTITIDGSSGIASVDGSAGSPSVRGSDANSGILYTSDAIKFSTGGTQRAVIDNNGLSSAGHIVQVVAGSTNSRVTTSSSSFVASNLTASITPKVSSNKIYVQVSGDGNTEGNGRVIYITLYRSTDGGSNWTDLGDSSGNNAGFLQLYGASSRIIVPVCFNFLDSPSTTSAVSYKVYVRANAQIEYPANDGAQYAYIHLFEVAA
tara:strand:+ start:50 stop:661 length:612 start_codon:yes stop_codon:yes gene_type:complete